MPTRFLSDAEIKRLEGWPEAIDPPGLARYFDLDADDLEFVRRQHGPAAQLGVALQLCSLRWLGFVPDDLTTAPPDAITVPAAALDVSPRVIFEYSVRPQTRREHRPMVREHAGFRPGALAELDALAGWLTEKALEHDRPSLLLGELVGELRRNRIERPAMDRLMRVVASARERAGEQTFQRLASQLTPALREALDRLLVPDPVIAGRTRHAWLRSRPTTISAKAMHRELDKRVFLIETIAPIVSISRRCRRTGGRGWRRLGGSRPTKRLRGWRPSGATRC